MYSNNSHGSYPYESWGINQQLDAALTVDFGREVEVDRIDITIRCDFPHDSYWTQASYPYESWGINQQLDAALTVDFGREVEVDRIDITIRCDFPHDSYWTQATLEFSDGSTEIINLEKTHIPQKFVFDKKVVTWVKFCELIQDTDPSPFPALTQIDIFGKNYLK